MNNIKSRMDAHVAGPPHLSVALFDCARQISKRMSVYKLPNTR